jgi:alpha-L-fucosidase
MQMLPLLAAVALAQAAPTPLAPVPSARQLAWHRMQYYAFIHFGPNTFTGEEWGHGTEDPKLFNPAKLDCRQWARTFKAAGMTGIVITAKHHDGFCLWPSKYSTHTVAQSAWKGGKGDVLKELSAACKAEGLKMGVYLSPWDRNHPAYGTPEYNEVFKKMLREVLTKYGTIFEVWFDGANGEGPNGKRQVYDWPAFVQVVRECQPNAVIFSDAGPDIRWVGNENGFAGETNWGMIDRSKFSPGVADQAVLNTGDKDGPDWVPAECDVSIRPGWFWRASENAKVKTVDQLMDIWYGSVGRGSNLLLNVPPNSSGLISQEDVDRLIAFKTARDTAIKYPVRVVSASSTESRGKGFEAANMIDGKKATFWAAPDGTTKATLDFELDAPGWDMIHISEAIALGQRVSAFEIQVPVNDGWRTVATGTTVGPQRFIRTGHQIARRVRVIISSSRACPAIASFAVFDRQTDGSAFERKSVH